LISLVKPSTTINKGLIALTNAVHSCLVNSNAYEKYLTGEFSAADICHELPAADLDMTTKDERIYAEFTFSEEDDSDLVASHLGKDCQKCRTTRCREHELSCTRTQCIIANVQNTGVRIKRTDLPGCFCEMSSAQPGLRTEWRVLATIPSRTPVHGSLVDILELVLTKQLRCMGSTCTDTQYRRSMPNAKSISISTDSVQ